MERRKLFKQVLIPLNSLHLFRAIQWLQTKKLKFIFTSAQCLRQRIGWVSVVSVKKTKLCST